MRPVFAALITTASLNDWRKRMSRSDLNRGLQACAAIILATGTSISSPAVRHVNCDKHSLGDVLAKADPGDNVQVAGTCRERIAVAVDGVTLDGQRSAVVDGGGSAGG